MIKKLLIALTLSLFMGFSSYAQECSPERKFNTAMTSLKENNPGALVAHLYDDEEAKDFMRVFNDYKEKSSIDADKVAIFSKNECVFLVGLITIDDYVRMLELMKDV